MHDESVEVIESEGSRSESVPKYLSAFHRNSERPTTSLLRGSRSQKPNGGNQLLRMRSDMEDIEDVIPNGTSEDKISEGFHVRQVSSIAETRRPTTAGRPGTTSGRPGSVGARHASTRPHPQSPEPSEVGASEDDDEYDEMNSTQVEILLDEGISTEFYGQNIENDTSGDSEFEEYLIDESNLGGNYEKMEYFSELLNEIPDKPKYFLPTSLDCDPKYLEDEESWNKKYWREMHIQKKREVLRKEVLYSCNAGVHRAGYRVYNPADYEGLNTSAEIKELFEYTTKFVPNTANSQVEVKLRPFIPEYSPSVGDIDAFIKVIHEDVNKDGLGIQVLDEPCAYQSDPSVLDLHLRSLAKQSSAKAIVVKKVENVNKNTKIIETWIKDISDLHRTKSSPSVHYSKPMPDIDSLLQEWPREFEELLKTVTLPSPIMECDLKTYVDLICNLLDIPVYKSRIQSLHLLASLYLTHKSFNSFGPLGGNNANEYGIPVSTVLNRNDDVEVNFNEF